MFVSPLTSSHLICLLFFLFAAALQPFLTLTADAHCSGKSGLDRKSNKRATMPEAASCGLLVHILCLFYFCNVPPKNQRSLLHCWLKHFHKY